VLKENHSGNPKAIELFRQEAIVLSQLHHPGIPLTEPDAYFQFTPRNSTESLHCILMEKIDGPNLREWMKQQGNHAINEQQALNWLMQLTEILDRVHQKNYFHRDIKPENIMLRSTGQLVLVDFGAAREMTYTYLAQLGSASGVTRISSAGYTPPEQEQGQAVPQSDFYALGRTFIYLLTGKQPTDQGIYDSLSNEFHWRSHARQVSAPLADLIDQLIATKAVDRPNNTEAILSQLTQVARVLAVGQTNAATNQDMTIQPPTLPQTLSESGVNSRVRDQVNDQVNAVKPARQQRWLIGGAVALLVGLGGWGLWQMYSHDQPDQPASVATASLILERSLTGHASFVNSMAINRDGKTLVSGSADSTIKIWDMETGEVLRTLTGHTGYVNALDISPNGQTLASGDADGNLKIWNLKTGDLIRKLTGHVGFVSALHISPDGQILASGDADNSIKIWNLKTGALLHTLKSHVSFINALCMSPDGKLLVSASADRTIKVWDLATEKVLHTLVGHTSYVNAIVFSPDGKTLVSASADNTIKVWDLATGQVLHTLVGHTSYVNSLAIKIDGKALLSSSADQTIRIWNLETGQELRKLTAAGAPLDYFVVSPDWQTIVTGKGDNIMRVWKFEN
jgi:WD40 repeat protein